MHHTNDERAVGSAGSAGSSKGRRAAQISRWRPIHHLGRATTALLAAPAFMLSIATAHAAPPTNDDPEDAIIVLGLPFTDTVDTTDATTEEGISDCWGTQNGVWYEYAAEEDGRVLVTTTGSNTETVLDIYRDPIEDPNNYLVCSAGSDTYALFDAIEGETYYIRLGTPSGGTPGVLQIQIQEGPPPLEVVLTVNPKATVAPKTGETTVFGTVYCSRQASGDVCGSLEQRILGHLKIVGDFCGHVECPDEGTYEWTATATSFEGYFKGGKATVSAGACACDQLECACDDVEPFILQISGGT